MRIEGVGGLKDERWMVDRRTGGSLYGTFTPVPAPIMVIITLPQVAEILRANLPITI